MIYKRIITDSLVPHIEAFEATVIVGARQTGKTTLLRMLQEQIEKTGRPSFFINLENPEYLTLLNESALNIFRLLPLSTERTFVFIDEVQYLEKPSRFIKLLYDEHKDKIKIIASGSSAFYLDQKFTDSLAGRKRIFTLMPLNFSEFLHFKGKDSFCHYFGKEAFGRLNDFENISVLERNEIVDLFREYALYGSYPRVALSSTTEEKKMQLEELVTSYIKKDVLENSVRKEEKFFHLLRILAERPGCLLNIQELASTLKISATAIDHFLYVITKSFHGTLIRPYYMNIRSELTKMPRFFFNDTGIRNFLAGSFDNRIFSDGRLLENMVFVQLLRRLGGNADEIRFWRTQSGSEIDFVLPQKKIALEVKCNPSIFKPSKVKLFSSAYPEFSIAVATWFDSAGKPFPVVPAWYL